MKTIITKIDPNDTDTLKQAADIIRNGGLVAFPTDTVYGLGADALNPEAVRRLYEAKGRPSIKPLILLISSVEDADRYVLMNPLARILAQKFWPGPLTLVLPAREFIPSITLGGQSTAGVRMPNNETALKLIDYVGTPIAAPSANLSGRPSPVDAESVAADLNGKVDMILDGGSTELGIVSTVVDVTEAEHMRVLRDGGVTREELMDRIIRAAVD